ncbi:FtsK/SpoIIIE domain-containing protein [Brevibacillus thermoruber]|uniref:FtsK/SpoIIIE domain-containing protein n=1 Tax=Brevibacillus thermoruber TaxID=33942 RepID=UPI004042CA6B
MLDMYQLLGQWTTELIIKYFQKQKQNNADKLFIKITGIHPSAVHGLLYWMEKREEDLRKFYQPIIRTISQIEQFPHFACKQHETTTWLRNNTKHQQALLLILNDMSTEAQSLENIFSIDEARLLSKEGLEVLMELLVQQYEVYPQEAEKLIDFFELYKQVADPQLQHVLAFTYSIISDEKSKSIIDRIQSNLPKLQLFVDTRLTIQKSSLARLKKNYYLSRLQQEGRELDTDKLIDRVYEFLEAEQSNNFDNDIWEKTTPETLRDQALSFIHRQSNELLSYEYDFVSKLFTFKTRKKKLDAEVAEFTEQLNLNESQKQLVQEVIEDIKSEEQIESIQIFMEEFSEELNTAPALQKKLTRFIEKVRNPHVYTDWLQGLICESFSLLEENLSESTPDNWCFELTIIGDVPKGSKELLKFYLKNITRYIPLIKLNSEHLNQLEERDARSKDDGVQFELSLIIGDERNIRRYKWVNSKRSELRSLIQIFQENGFVPYIKTYADEQAETIDLAVSVQEQVKEYVTTGEIKQDDIQDFVNFIYRFNNWIRESLENGLGSISINELERELYHLLSRVNHSVLLSRHIFQYIGCLGSIDTFTCKKGQVGKPIKRVLTLLNPIRLLSFVKRLTFIQEELLKWKDPNFAQSISVEELNEYLQYVFEKNSALAPQYFTAEGYDAFLLEQQELCGEGTFILNGHSEDTEYLMDAMADELVACVKNYLEVYPYAKDCLDILFLYCPHPEYVTHAVELIFKQTDVQKMKILVHSDREAAKFHQYLNGWMALREEFIVSDSKIPLLEIQVIGEQNVNKITEAINGAMSDVDIAILLNYFGQSNNIQYKFEKVSVQTTDNWFGTICQEPLKKEEAVKRLAIVSEQLPEVMQQFYKLQYTLHTQQILPANEDYLLKSIVSISSQEDMYLINYIHGKANWSLIIDRFMDKSLLRKVSSKAQIIRYKSGAGKQRRYKSILSSSKYIRKLANQTNDHDYYDRLYHKYVALLKNQDIERDIIIRAIDRVKDISGGVVMKAIGPGKFAHELLGLYLACEARAENDNGLQVWALCDELPWFQKNQRRPDVIRINIHPSDNGISIQFELIEVKFINHMLLDKERYDAIKQIKAGNEQYKRLFNLSELRISAEYWRKELVRYLVELSTYSVSDAHLLKTLQQLPLERIHTTVSGSIDIYVYTSNLVDYPFATSMIDGKFSEQQSEDTVTNIYNRSYILRALGAKQENIEPEYLELQEQNNEFGRDKVDQDVILKEDNTSVFDLVAVTKEEGVETLQDEIELTEMNEAALYPEQSALQNLQLTYDDEEDNIAELAERYAKKLRVNFDANGIPIRVRETIIGSSVIRMLVDIPSNLSVNKIKHKADDVQLWLQLNSSPHIFINNKGLNIDINREKPQTIYFEKFMALVREQFTSEKVRLSGRMVAPLGVGPLNDIIYFDFANSETAHLLIGGQTGSGKSVTINSIILSIMCLYTQEDVRFIFIDPKKVEFSIFERCAHTRAVLTDLREAVDMLEQVAQEMEQRYEMFKNEYVTSIDQYIEATNSSLPRMIVIFDEFADFMLQDAALKKRVENAIERLGNKARAAGIHLLVCTQNPKADIIPTNIRNNFGARLALKMADHNASGVILDEEGAEKLGGKGDFLAKITSGQVLRGKSPFLTTTVKRALLQHFSSKTLTT